MKVNDFQDFYVVFEFPVRVYLVVDPPPVNRLGRGRARVFYNKRGRANGIEASADVDARVEVLLLTPMMLSLFPNCCLFRKIC